MKHFVVALIFSLLAGGASAELSKRDQYYIEEMTRGELRSLKAAAKDMHGAGYREPLVLDVAAEILLQLHNDSFPNQVDTLSWLARAIGRSGNGRYYTTLNDVVNGSGHKKLRRHAKKALRELGEEEGEQYRLGMRKIPENDYYR